MSRLDPLHFPNGSDNLGFLYMNLFSVWFVSPTWSLLFGTPVDVFKSVGNWKCGIRGGCGRIEKVFVRKIWLFELLRIEPLRFPVNALNEVFCLA